METHHLTENTSHAKYVKFASHMSWSELSHRWHSSNESGLHPGNAAFISIYVRLPSIWQCSLFCIQQGYLYHILTPLPDLSRTLLMFLVFMIQRCKIHLSESESESESESDEMVKWFSISLHIELNDILTNLWGIPIGKVQEVLLEWTDYHVVISINLTYFVVIKIYFWVDQACV